MKTALTILAITAIAMIITTGCAEKKEAPIVIQPQTDRCTVEGYTAPEWVCVGEKLDGYYTAEGYSLSSRGGHGITMDRAYNEGIGKLALIISTDVKAKMTSFTETTGLNKYETVDTAFKKIVKQSSSLQAQEVETLRHWEHPKSGGIYLMVGVKRDNIYDRAKQATFTSFKNDAAIMQKMKMDKVAEALDNEFKERQLNQSTAVEDKPGNKNTSLIEVIAPLQSEKPQLQPMSDG